MAAVRVTKDKTFGMEYSHPPKCGMFPPTEVWYIRAHLSYVAWRLVRLAAAAVAAATWWSEMGSGRVAPRKEAGKRI